MHTIDSAFSPTRADARTFTFFRDLEQPYLLEARKPSLIDRYNVRLLMTDSVATSIVYSFHSGDDGAVFPWERPIWEVWLPEVSARMGVQSQAASVVGQQIEEIRIRMGLSDSQLAAMFPGGVTRETVNRWRNQPSPNLRPANLYRLGLLHDLLGRIEEAGLNPTIWLQQPLEGDLGSPYELICVGRLGEVRSRVDSIAAGFHSTTASIPQTVEREHDTVIEDDDDGEWIWEGDE